MDRFCVDDPTVDRINVGAKNHIGSRGRLRAGRSYHRFLLPLPYFTIEAHEIRRARILVCYDLFASYSFGEVTSMNTKIPQRILDCADITEISQLVLRERESRDLGKWDTMRDCFHDDSTVKLSWFNGSGAEFVTGSIDMANRGVFAKHRLGPVLVTLAGARAVATCGIIIDIPKVIDGVDLILSAHGRLVYRTEKRDEVWRIFSLDCLYVRDELTPAILGTTVNIAPSEMEGFRASYRNLSYCLMKTGYEVDQALPGDDRPETVEKLMDEIDAWANL